MPKKKATKKRKAPKKKGVVGFTITPDSTCQEMTNSILDAAKEALEQNMDPTIILGQGLAMLQLFFPGDRRVESLTKCMENLKPRKQRRKR